MRGLSGNLASYGSQILGTPVSPYTGMFAAPMSGGQTNVLNAINKLALPVGGDGANAPPLGNLAFGDQSSQLISSILGGGQLSPTSNPYLGSTLDYMRDQAQRTLGGNMNLLDAAFGGAGMGSGSGRSIAAANLARQSTSDVNNNIAQILSGNYQQGVQNQLSTLGSVVPTFNNLNSNLLFSALGANALPQQTQQNDLSARYQDFLRQQTQPLQNAQSVASILGTPGYQYMTPQYAPSQFSQLLSGASSLLGPIAMLSML